jgi:hypothetical protein
MHHSAPLPTFGNKNYWVFLSRLNRTWVREERRKEWRNVDLTISYIISERSMIFHSVTLLLLVSLYLLWNIFIFCTLALTVHFVKWMKITFCLKNVHKKLYVPYSHFEPRLYYVSYVIICVSTLHIKFSVMFTMCVIKGLFRKCIHNPRNLTALYWRLQAFMKHRLSCTPTINTWVR